MCSFFMVVVAIRYSLLFLYCSYDMDDDYTALYKGTFGQW